MNKRILAIGGHVIKTARLDLEKVIKRGNVEMLIHNGGSIFHDFQLSTDLLLNSIGNHSYSLDKLIENPGINRPTSLVLWSWIEGKEEAPDGSITKLCESLSIPVLLFTSLGCDFWHLFKGEEYWAQLAKRMYVDFDILRTRLKYPFHYVCMGSAVIHPEVFTKAISGIQKPKFRADVVDFLDMYRPRTRVAKYGEYYKVTHKEYLQKLLKEVGDEDGEG